MQNTVRWLLAAWLIGLPGLASADKVFVAVASNFTAPMQRLISLYASRSADEVVLSAGSTGKLYAQIRNGAPFDIFLAADTVHPRRLEEAGDAVPGSRYTYALGRLVLWSARNNRVDAGTLRTGDFKHLALANPRLAPYGAAAEQVLERLNLLAMLKPRLVYGENIGQTYQFVAGGGAELGFVAMSQIVRRESLPGAYWPVPDTLHDPIEQQAVSLNTRPATDAFYRFLTSAQARDVIQQYGYRLPDSGSLDAGEKAGRATGR